MDVYTSVVMAAIRQIIAVGALLAGSLGCHSPFPFEGRWTGTNDLPLAPDTSAPLATTLRRVTLDVQPGGKCELIELGVPRTGLLHVSGNTARLETVMVLGRAVDSAPKITLTGNTDGTISLSNPENHSSGPIILHRESQPTDPSVRKGSESSRG